MEVIMESQTQELHRNTPMETSQEKIWELGPNDYHQYYGHWFMWILIMLAFLGVITNLVALFYLLFFKRLP